MPIRNPFRRAGPAEVNEEAQRSNAENEFKNTAVSGAKPLHVDTPSEYKLSEINDSGVYLPPSPTQEKPAFWHSKSNTSTTSSNHRSMLSENEPFNISRESFDSYRRSFDISARSPMQDILGETYPRQSLDARRSVDTRRSLDVRRSRATPRSSMQQHRPNSANPVPEEGFEDVGLNDESKPVPQKKRSIFARFGDNSSNDKQEERPTSGHHFSLTGRKRAESGGAELKPMSKGSSETPVESR
ncbi:hypothetical protein P153DRAFT_286469 [Dothidotthia symphoricarpi CBS 119687]|uniref:Uncharacterized protein n=1 Tax=Dothidotthia symphoricarpi CBS 119687 TaxID=1392245 RepID=A0A6A6AIF2_9PLEO|nr:uncharacterized protein P153DRAFT_286469 [Dothidotthia symphoricarpi CBS 119687]KAF2131742.1 hypothetical protein P153DRAFT_286469 [Dothidotthia symphoricarpi CBS 119687]